MKFLKMILNFISKIKKYVNFKFLWIMIISLFLEVSANINLKSL